MTPKFPIALKHRTAAAACSLALSGLLAAAHAAPAAGRYDGQLCVAIRAGAPDCGPASVEWRSPGIARVRVSDLLYSLTLKSSQVDVVLKHGAMQIDAFTGRYEWDGSTLQFIDADKGVRYEVKVGKRRRPPSPVR
jgi:hypothetical protein